MAQWYSIWKTTWMQWESFVEWMHYMKTWHGSVYKADFSSLEDEEVGDKLKANKKRTGVTHVYFDYPGGDDGQDQAVATLLVLNIDGIVSVLISKPLKFTGDPDDVADQFWDGLIEDVERETKLASKDRDEKRAKEGNKASPAKRSPQRKQEAPMINVVLWDDVGKDGKKIPFKDVTHAYVGKRATKQGERFITVKINGKWLQYSTSTGDSLHDDAGGKVPSGFKRVAKEVASKKIPTYG